MRHAQAKRDNSMILDQNAVTEDAPSIAREPGIDLDRSFFRRVGVSGIPAIFAARTAFKILGVT